MGSESFTLSILNNRATRLIESAQKVEVCGFVDDYGSADEPLHKYILPDGRIYREAEQTTLFSKEGYDSVKVYLALKNEKGNWIPNSLWRKQEMLPFEDWK